jgi:hypothetical protein
MILPQVILLNTTAREENVFQPLLMDVFWVSILDVEAKVSQDVLIERGAKAEAVLIAFTNGERADIFRGCFGLNEWIPTRLDRSRLLATFQLAAESAIKKCLVDPSPIFGSYPKLLNDFRLTDAMKLLESSGYESEDPLEIEVIGNCGLARRSNV